jgi:hypothetical protein
MAQTLIEGVTNYWCRTLGIHNRDLDTHPQMDDVIILIKYRDSIWSSLNKSEQSHWGAVWDWCYHRKYPLKKKHLTKLETIYLEAKARHIEKIVKQAKARNRIKQLRQV